MRPKSLILLLLALGCGLVASIGISQVMDRRNRDVEPAGEKEPILVAIKDIKVNEPLSDKNSKLEDWPKEKIPNDAIRDPADLMSQRAGTMILSGEPIRRAKFAIDKRIEEIPAGYRVFTVSADAVTATGNLLQPGDRVDLVLSVRNNGAASNQLAKTILQDLKVFAVNEQWQPFEGEKSHESIPAKTVSLLVTPAQSETIALATEMGKIRLVLRNPNDDLVADTPGAEENEVMTGSTRGDRNKESGTSKGNVGSDVLKWLTQQSSSAPQAAAPVPDPIQTFSVELIKGGEVSRVDFNRRNDEDRWVPIGSSGTVSSGTGGSPRTPTFSAPDPTVSIPTPAGGPSPGTDL